MPPQVPGQGTKKTPHQRLQFEEGVMRRNSTLQVSLLTATAIVAISAASAFAEEARVASENAKPALVELAALAGVVGGRAVAANAGRQATQSVNANTDTVTVSARRIDEDV